MIICYSQMEPQMREFGRDRQRSDDGGGGCSVGNEDTNLWSYHRYRRGRTTDVTRMAVLPRVCQNAPQLGPGTYVHLSYHTEIRGEEMVNLLLSE